MPFSLVERVWFVAVLVTLRPKSVVVGVGSTKSIVPLTVTVYDPLELVQPAKSTCTESGIGSPSEFAGEAGVRVGVHAAVVPTPAGGASCANRPLPDALKVIPSGRVATSLATTSPTA